MPDKFTIHLVYPVDKSRMSSPWSVGNNLLKVLQTQFKVEVHDWNAKYQIQSGFNDILIGHPHPNAKTVFRKSFNGQWAFRYVICPFTTNPQQMYFVEPYARRADAFFAICGPVWANDLSSSLYAHLGTKFVHLDMAIDSDNWPPLERLFAEPGKRKFAFIGSSLGLKGTPFFEHLAVRRLKHEMGWIGASRWVRSNADCIKYLDLNSEQGRKDLAQYDFVISPGRSDANPTVLLEAMSLGLIPICTKRSGYDDEEHFYQLEYGNVEGGIAVLDSLQRISNEELIDRQKKNYSYVTSYSWERFTSIVIEQIRSDIMLTTQNVQVNFNLRGKILEFCCSLNSPYRKWRSTAFMKFMENRFYYRSAQILWFFKK
jgi:hypothetical protein